MALEKLVLELSVPFHTKNANQRFATSLESRIFNMLIVETTKSTKYKQFIQLYVK